MNYILSVITMLLPSRAGTGCQEKAHPSGADSPTYQHTTVIVSAENSLHPPRLHLASCQDAAHELNRLQSNSGKMRQQSSGEFSVVGTQSIVKL